MFYLVPRSKNMRILMICCISAIFLERYLDHGLSLPGVPGPHHLQPLPGASLLPLLLPLYLPLHLPRHGTPLPRHVISLPQHEALLS